MKIFWGILMLLLAGLFCAAIWSGAEKLTQPHHGIGTPVIGLGVGIGGLLWIIWMSRK